MINTHTLHIPALINTMYLLIMCNVQKTGWASSILSTRLGSANSRSMGTPNCGWIPTGIDSNSLPDPCATPNKVLNRKVQITTEVQELLDKGAILETQLTPQNFVSQIFLGEKGWGPETRAYDNHQSPDIFQPN